MNKMRVYEYAKQNNMASRDVIKHLQELNIDVSNHMSTITADICAKLDEKINPKANPSNEQKEDRHRKETKTKSKQKKERNPKKKKRGKKGKQSKAKKGKKDSSQSKHTTTRQTRKVMTNNRISSVEKLVNKQHKDTSEIIKNLIFHGVMATKHQDLNDDAIELICAE